ncbi:aldehyde dehydrogenase family protein, partial [Bacillus amyloliquefaciens]|uniref:aldehyde dehydrogenase family protein n=1 Tax=Bacillus amyloliquefaciens TaxID=1390 RepID=UPI0028468C7E
HEPFTDFSQEENRKAFEQALAKVTESLGQTYPLVINGERIETKDQIISINPANKDEVVGTVSKAGKEEAEQAVQAAAKAVETGRYTSPEERASVIFRAAASIRRKKHEYSALLVKEAGKPWNEADADTAEAIDFLEYYARQMLELAKGKPVNSREGEHNQYVYT